MKNTIKSLVRSSRPLQSSRRSIIHGFTLIEMLVVIAIIAILTGIIVANLSGAKEKARDAKRISDMGQIQMALQLYFDRCNVYPEKDNNDYKIVTSPSNCTKINSVTNDEYSILDFIAKIPVPTPEGGQDWYEYEVNDDDNPTDYVLHVTLEKPNAVVKDGLYGSSVFHDAQVFGCDGIDMKQYCLGPR